MSNRTPAPVAKAGRVAAAVPGKGPLPGSGGRDEQAIADYTDNPAARGPVDYLFCHAGVGFGQPYCATTTHEDGNTIFDGDVFGVVHCVPYAAPPREAGERAPRHHVVLAGISPPPYQTIYVASKQAVYGFARALRSGLAEKNIAVSVVCPGAVATTIFHQTLDYSLHFELPPPPTAIGIDQAAAEILEGIRNGQEIITVNEDARGLYKAIRAGDFGYVEAVLQIVQRMKLEARGNRSTAVSSPGSGSAVHGRGDKR